MTMNYQSPDDRSSKTSAEDFAVILENIESIEDKLERKIDDIALDVCKLKEIDNFKLSLSREYICRIKEENAQLKAQIVSLKERVDYTTFDMSHLNTKLKLIEEEKQSLVTAIKILQVKELDNNVHGIWQTATARKQRENSQFKFIEVLTDSEDRVPLVNRYSELTDEHRTNEEQSEQTCRQKRQLISEQPSQRISEQLIEKEKLELNRENDEIKKKNKTLFQSLTDLRAKVIKFQDEKFSLMAAMKLIQRENELPAERKRIEELETENNNLRAAARSLQEDLDDKSRKEKQEFTKVTRRNREISTIVDTSNSLETKNQYEVLSISDQEDDVNISVAKVTFTEPLEAG